MKIYPKVTVKENGRIVITHEIKQLREFTAEKYEDLIEQVERSVVRQLSKPITDQIFNDVMKKINIDAIANATSVQIIQNMAQKNRD